MTPGSANETASVICRYHGRNFTSEEIRALKSLIQGPPSLNRHQISREFCRLVGWYKPDGGLKDMAARVAMLRMERDGLIVLPPSQQARRARRSVSITQRSDPPARPVPGTLGDALPLRLLRITRSEPRTSSLWNEYMERYHYMRYKTLCGAQIRYLVEDRNGVPLAAFSFSAAAWRLAPRDRYIGWSDRIREKNLACVINNSRLLVLPWGHIPNLVSHLLSQVRRQIASQWKERYNVSPVLMETFVDRSRFSGTCYRASGWIHVGITKGRGRQDTQSNASLPPKDIWLCPLRKDWKRILVRLAE